MTREQIQADAARRRNQREADRDRHRLEDLRLKALGEQARGAPGVWTAEYQARLAEFQHIEVQNRARAAANAKTFKSCALIVAIVGGAGLALLAALVIYAFATVPDPAPPSPTEPLPTGKGGGLRPSEPVPRPSPPRKR